MQALVHQYFIWATIESLFYIISLWCTETKHGDDRRSWEEQQSDQPHYIFFAGCDNWLLWRFWRSYVYGGKKFFCKIKYFLIDKNSQLESQKRYLKSVFYRLGADNVMEAFSKWIVCKLLFVSCLQVMTNSEQTCYNVILSHMFH